MPREKITRSIVLLSFLGLVGSILWIPQPSISQTVSSSTTRKVRPSRIPPPLTPQSKELAEAERLNHQVVELENQSKFNEATPLAERALAIREKALGPDHPLVAVSLETAAQLYEKQGKRSEAIPLKKRALAIREKLALGEKAFDGPGEGIGAAQDVDFGPYIAELQHRVKHNWNPPEQGNPRRSVLRFSISRAGEVSNLRVGKTSGNPDSDAAAMDAVHRAAPFQTLPADYKGKNINIQFTFDINVDGIKIDGENKRPTEPAVDRPAYDHSKSYKSSD
jgi:TonB family protein